MINSSSGTVWSTAREERREVPARQSFPTSRSCSRCLKRELKLISCRYLLRQAGSSTKQVVPARSGTRRRRAPWLGPTAVASPERCCGTAASGWGYGHTPSPALSDHQHRWVDSADGRCGAGSEYRVLQRCHTLLPGIFFLSFVPSCAVFVTHRLSAGTSAAITQLFLPLLPSLSERPGGISAVITKLALLRPRRSWRACSSSWKSRAMRLRAEPAPPVRC